MNNDPILTSYLRDKGALNVTDRNPLEILKELLRQENKGIYSTSVERCTHITTEELDLEYILIGNMDHFNRVEPRRPESPSSGTLVTGVVVRSSRGDRIVDGYHRLKHSLEQGVTSGLFIVISHTEDE